MVILIVIVMGLIVGSFLNAVIFRLHSREHIFIDRSKCVNCGHKLGALDLVPIFSFVFLRGRCRYCKRPISWQYPLIELATAICFALLAINYGLRITDYGFFIQAIFICFLIIIAVYDLKHYLILDKVVFPALVLSLVWSIINGQLVNSLYGALTISGFFLLQYAVSRGRWIGFGDVKLGLFLGSMAGLKLVIPLLLLAYFSGVIIGLTLIAAGKKQLSSRLPFGTFLGFSGIIIVLYGDRILSWYLSLTGL